MDACRGGVEPQHQRPSRADDRLAEIARQQQAPEQVSLVLLGRGIALGRELIVCLVDQVRIDARLALRHRGVGRQGGEFKRVVRQPDRDPHRLGVARLPAVPREQFLQLGFSRLACRAFRTLPRGLQLRLVRSDVVDFERFGILGESRDEFLQRSVQADETRLGVVDERELSEARIAIFIGVVERPANAAEPGAQRVRDFEVSRPGADQDRAKMLLSGAPEHPHEFARQHRQLRLAECPRLPEAGDDDVAFRIARIGQ